MITWHSVGDITRQETWDRNCAGKIYEMELEAFFQNEKQPEYAIFRLLNIYHSLGIISILQIV